MRGDLYWLFVVLVVCVMLQACQREHMVQAPSVFIVLTKDKEVGGSVASANGPLTSDARLVDPVVRVVSRLVAAAQRSEYGPAARARCWVLAVYDNKSQTQAFVRPNGSIVVYTGAFPLAQTEAGLAALLSHELAHALIVDHRPISSSCAGVTEQPPILVTREEESQADEKGLLLLADAGYDPRELLALWGRMKQQESKTGDEVLVHVTYDRRMEQIAQRLPHALMRYEHAHRAPQKALPLLN